MPIIDKNNFSWKELLIDSSKQLVELGVKICEEEPELFPPLFELAMKQEGRFSRRAARIVYYTIEKHPLEYEEYINKILYSFDEITDESIKFNFLKIFTFSELPEDEEEQGMLTKVCFEALEANYEGVASKVYAIEILYRISQIFPEFKRELLFLLEQYKEGAKFAYISRANKLINKLRKELKIKSYE